LTGIFFCDKVEVEYLLLFKNWEEKKMVKFCKLLLVLILFVLVLRSAPAKADASITVQPFLQVDGQSVTVMTYATKKFSTELGVFGFSLVSPAWSEAYVGLIYDPAEWIEFGLGGGIESNNIPLRTGGFVWMGNDTYSLYACLEYGGSGYWYQVKAIANVDKTFGLGLFAQRYLGVGPRLEVNVPSAQLYLAPLYDFEVGKFGVLTGVSMNWK
jgi:hypothetical protein